MIDFCEKFNITGSNNNRKNPGRPSDEKKEGISEAIKKVCTGNTWDVP